MDVVNKLFGFGVFLHKFFDLYKKSAIKVRHEESTRRMVSLVQPHVIILPGGVMTQNSVKLLIGGSLLILVLADAQASQSAAADYEGKLVRTIQQHWQGGKNLRGLECSELGVSIAPNGAVVSVTGGGGNEAVCEAARKTLLHIKRLPVPSSELYVRYQTMFLTLQPGRR